MAIIGAVGIEPGQRSSVPVAATSLTPPPWVPLRFLAAAGVGLAALGLAAWFAADRAVVSPAHSGVVSAVHVGVLAFLTMAVLGLLHQLAPVVSGRPLRSVVAARVTWWGMVATAWLLPSGFAHGPEALVAAGGVVGALTVSVAAWNLSGPLSARGGGVTLAGLRFAVAYLVITVAFGVVYAFDRQAAWFPLLPNRVLAHAHLGLFGWLGLTYVAVAEKLWPMFLQAPRPRARSGAVAVGLLAGGTPLLAAGLLLGVPTIAWTGGIVVAGGAGAHLVSLAGALRHRGRPLELLDAHLVASACFLVVAAGFGLAAGVADVDPGDRAGLVAAEVASLIGWLGLGVVGHAHRIAPNLTIGALHARGAAGGPPLAPADLIHDGLARLSFVAAVGGFAAIVIGLALDAAPAVAAGGASVAATGALVIANLAGGPRRAARRA